MTTIGIVVGLLTGFLCAMLVERTREVLDHVDDLLSGN